MQATLNHLKYIKTDGLNLIDLFNKTFIAEQTCRFKRKPVFLHMKTVRLMGHAGSDVELGYQSIKEIEYSEKNDPLLHSSRILIENNCLTNEEILSLYELSRNRVNHIFNTSTLRPTLMSSDEVMSSILLNTDLKEIPKNPHETYEKIN